MAEEQQPPPPEPPAKTQTGLSGNEVKTDFAPPPKRVESMPKQPTDTEKDDPTSYNRDPHRLIAYLVPFPKPNIPSELAVSHIPDRFFIYTPPPPPLTAPKEGEDEARMIKMQRKWQEGVRAAKQSEAKLASWEGVKGRATKGLDYAMKWTTSSSLDFMNRIPTGKAASSTPAAKSSPNTITGQEATNLPVENEVANSGKEDDEKEGLEEMVLVYPSSLPGSEKEIRAEFVNSMLRTKSKAQRDSIIATGLLPIAWGIDMLAIFIWPFGGLSEIDTVWGYNSMKGAWTASSVTKRLDTPEDENNASDDGKNLKLTFTPSERLNVLRNYLVEQLHKKNPRLFISGGPPPSESNILEAIGWEPATVPSGDEMKDREDRQWEISEVKEDIKETFNKASTEWDKWCKAFEKDPGKALEKS